MRIKSVLGAALAVLAPAGAMADGNTNTATADVTGDPPACGTWGPRWNVPSGGLISMASNNPIMSSIMNAIGERHTHVMISHGWQNASDVFLVDSSAVDAFAGHGAAPGWVSQSDFRPIGGHTWTSSGGDLNCTGAPIPPAHLQRPQTGPQAVNQAAIYRRLYGWLSTEGAEVDLRGKPNSQLYDKDGLPSGPNPQFNPAYGHSRSENLQNSSNYGGGTCSQNSDCVSGWCSGCERASASACTGSCAALCRAGGFGCSTDQDCCSTGLYPAGGACAVTSIGKQCKTARYGQTSDVSHLKEVFWQRPRATDVVNSSLYEGRNSFERSQYQQRNGDGQAVADWLWKSAPWFKQYAIDESVTGDMTSVVTRHAWDRVGTEGYTGTLSKIWDERGSDHYASDSWFWAYGEIRPGGSLGDFNDLTYDLHQFMNVERTNLGDPASANHGMVCSTFLAYAAAKAGVPQIQPFTYPKSSHVAYTQLRDGIMNYCLYTQSLQGQLDAQRGGWGLGASAHISMCTTMANQVVTCMATGTTCDYLSSDTWLGMQGNCQQSGLNCPFTISPDTLSGYRADLDWTDVTSCPAGSTSPWCKSGLGPWAWDTKIPIQWSATTDNIYGCWF